MDKAQERKSRLPFIGLGVFVVAVFVFSICEYLNTKDCYGLMGGPQTCITGWETLKIEWPSFWTWIIICSVVGVILLIVAIYNETGAGWLGKKLNGNSDLSLTLLIIAILLLITPWGKACTDKSNAGITAPGHKVEQTK
jgi:quinol-cytochrome oxidoreductase complex cytochrome b subunit